MIDDDNHILDVNEHWAGLPRVQSEKCGANAHGVAVNMQSDLSIAEHRQFKSSSDHFTFISATCSK